MLPNNYKNTDEILNSTKPTTAEWVDDKDKGLISSEVINVNFGDNNNQDKLELHVYSLKGDWIASNHEVHGWKRDSPKHYPTQKTKRIFIDVHDNLRQIGLTRGEYKIVYNFIRNHLGAYLSKLLFLKSISSNKKELVLSLVDQESEAAKALVRTFFDDHSGVNYIKENIRQANDVNTITTRNAIANQAKLNGLTFEEQLDVHARAIVKSNPDKYSVGGQYEYTYSLNFGSNKLLQVVNIARIGDSFDIAVKLYEPIPDDITEKSIVWIVSEVRAPHIDNIILYPAPVQKPTNTLRGANFDLDIDYGISTETDFKNWNELLSSNVNTSQQIIDNYFSGSLSGIKLNIGYCDFKNFVHFSSAVERVKNFKYKLELIEYYDQRLDYLLSVTGSVLNNINDTYQKRNAIVSGFDDFEKYLFFQSGSQIYTNSTCSIDPWPKQADVNNLGPMTWVQAWTMWQNATFNWNSPNATIVTSNPAKPYTLYSVTSSIAEAYYEDLLEKAKIYDKFNEDSLAKTIPEHIRLDAANEDYELFVNMIGHHFDISWTYVKHMTKISTREEHPLDGMSNDIIYDVAKSMGWNLTHGNQKSDLWKYVMGSDEDGSYQVSGSMMGTKSAEARTKEVWRRILNNLPYLLKTKGTSRSIRALVAAYGVPTTLIAIREYGGPAVYKTRPIFEKEEFNYALNFKGTGTYMTSKWYPVFFSGSYQMPDTITLRFKTHEDYNEFNYKKYTPHTILQVGAGPKPQFYVELEKSGSRQYGNMHFYLSGSNGYLTASINNIAIYDDDFSTLMIRRQHSVDVASFDNRYDFYVKKHKYGKLTINEQASILVSGTLGPVSASYNTSWYTPNTLYAGGYANNPSSGSNGYTGSFQELRYWMAPLSESIFDEHVISPSSYHGNYASASLEELAYRIPMLDRLNVNTTQSLISAHPNQIRVHFSGSWPMTASLFGTWPTELEDQWLPWEEVHYITTPSIGANNLYSQKIRIEANGVDRPLSPTKRVEISAYDKQPNDSNRLGVYFSPQNSINEDIFRELGFIELDNYIGDPSDMYNEYYRKLNDISTYYWRKYKNTNDIAAYLRLFALFDMSMFKQIKQLIPARANAVVGLVIEPNILERSKFAIRPLQIDSFTETGLIPVVSKSLAGTLSRIESAITASQPIEAFANKIDSVIVMPTANTEASASLAPPQLQEVKIPDIHLHSEMSSSDATSGLIQNYYMSGKGSQYVYNNLIWNVTNYKIGNTVPQYLTSSNAEWMSEGNQIVITGSRPSSNRSTLNYNFYYETPWISPNTASQYFASRYKWKNDFVFYDDFNFTFFNSSYWSPLTTWYSNGSYNITNITTLDRMFIDAFSNPTESVYVTQSIKLQSGSLYDISLEAAAVIYNVGSPYTYYATASLTYGTSSVVEIGAQQYTIGSGSFYAPFSGMYTLKISNPAPDGYSASFQIESIKVENMDKGGLSNILGGKSNKPLIAGDTGSFRPFWGPYASDGESYKLVLSDFDIPSIPKEANIKGIVTRIKKQSTAFIDSTMPYERAVVWDSEISVGKTTSLAMTGSNLAKLPQLSMSYVEVQYTAYATVTSESISPLGGTTPWTMPNDAADGAPNATYAYWAGTDGAYDASTRLHLKGFGFTIPTDAVIKGVQANVIGQNFEWGGTLPTSWEAFNIGLDKPGYTDNDVFVHSDNYWAYANGGAPPFGAIYPYITQFIFSPGIGDGPWTHGGTNNVFDNIYPSGSYPPWYPADINSSDFGVWIETEMYDSVVDVAVPIWFVDTVEVIVTALVPTYTIINAWPTGSYVKDMYGSSNNNWGQVWKPADLSNNPNFSVKLKVSASHASALLDGVDVKVYYNMSQSAQPAEVQDYIPLGVLNHRYIGCKLTANAINENSPETIDGGPVIEVIAVNPRTLNITQPSAINGGLDLGGPTSTS